MTAETLSVNERRLEWALAVAAAVGGAVVVAVALGYGLTNTTGVGAGFVPTVAGALLLLAGLAWMLQLVRRVREATTAEVEGSPLLELLTEEDVDDESPDHSFPDRAGWTRVGFLVAVVAVSALLVTRLGYTVTMFAQSALILIVLAKRRVWLALLVALAITLGSRLVFEVWLGTSLPHSTLPLLTRLGI